MHCGANSTLSYLHRPLPYHTEAPMKPTPLRARPRVQSDLFDTAAVPAPLRSLQLHHDELIEVLSRLLWQVARQAAAVEYVEDDDEQDQP
jgi:hypothetical protein